MEIARTPSSSSMVEAFRAQVHVHSAAGAGPGLAAGATIFVFSYEVIPETYRNGHQTPATFGFITGFALMLSLHATLG